MLTLTSMCRFLDFLLGVTTFYEKIEKCLTPHSLGPVDLTEFHPGSTLEKRLGSVFFLTHFR